MNDFKFGLRQLARNPGFTGVAVFTLALGIGANAVVATWTRNLLFNAVPGVAAPRELAVITIEHRDGTQGDTLSSADVDSLSAERSLFAGVTGSEMGTAAMRVGNTREWLWVEVPMANYFEVLGVRPVIGRGFLPGEDGPSPLAKTVIISHQLWQRRFGGNEDAVGRVIEMNRQPATIVGVAPEGFRGTMGGLAFDAWIVPSLYAEQSHLIRRGENRGWRWLHTVARLAPGAHFGSAKAAVGVMATRLADEFPQAYRDKVFRMVPIWRSPWGAQGFFMPVLQALAIAAALLLLLVTANVANLLLARAHRRETEIALRLALGASPVRIVRQMLIESLSLAALGGAGGIILALLGSRLLFTLMPPTYLPLTRESTVDGWVLVFTAGVTLITGVLFGLTPALQCLRKELQPILKEGSRSLVKTYGHPLRTGFVVGEVALAMVLLVCMGLCLRSFEKSHRVNLGINPDRVFVAGFRISPQDGDDRRVEDFYRRLRQSASALPDVESAALADWLPLGFEGGSTTGIRVPGYQPAPGESMDVDLSTVSPAYCSTLNAPIVAGREFSEADTTDRPFAVLINETFARRYFYGRTPVGLKLQVLGREAVVVGVVGDGKYRRLNEPQRAWVYVNQLQITDRDLTLVVRTHGSLEGMSRRIEQMAAAVDPTIQPVAALNYMDFIGAAWVVPRVAAVLLSLLGVTALFLSVLGVYAVLSQHVAQRTREMAIRMALGAPPKEVLSLVFRYGLTISLAGVAAGAAVCIGLNHFLNGLLIGVGAGDWVSWLTMTTLLLLAASLACWLPARRATRVDPMAALRAQ